jgi:hypothetical protein
VNGIEVVESRDTAEVNIQIAFSNQIDLSIAREILEVCLLNVISIHIELFSWDLLIRASYFK